MKEAVRLIPVSAILPVFLAFIEKLATSPELITPLKAKNTGNIALTGNITCIFSF